MTFNISADNSHNIKKFIYMFRFFVVALTVSIELGKPRKRSVKRRTNYRAILVYFEYHAPHGTITWFL